jgi:hypothetical protein
MKITCTVCIYTFRARYRAYSYTMHCTGGLELVREICSQRCRIQYSTKRYFTVKKNYTLLHLGIWLSRISRLSRTVPVLYVTQKQKNDYWYYYGEGTGTTRFGRNLLW